MSTAPRLDRELFETDRASEYLNPSELTLQTGQPLGRFGSVALKELVDNALDACEEAGVTPAITVDVEWQSDGSATLRVQDNAGGLPASAIEMILNFSTRTSSKAVYRSPTRGLQGNALKTVISIPTALCGAAAEPVVITSCGVRHSITIRTDPAGRVFATDMQQPVAKTVGTTVQLVLPASAWTMSTPQWVCFTTALFNPHAHVHFRPAVADVQPDVSGRWMTHLLYKPRVPWPDGTWRKWLPTDVTSPWWYDAQAFERLVYAHIAKAQDGGADKPLGAFIREFRGLKRSEMAKQVGAAVPGFRYLSDFEGQTDAIARLHRAMLRATEKPPSPDVLGVVGKEAMQKLVTDAETGDHYWYEKRTWLTKDNVPWAAEVAIAVNPNRTHSEQAWGLNYSAALADALDSTPLRAEMDSRTVPVQGLKNLLHTIHVTGPYAPYPTMTAVHLISPAMVHLDRGKGRLHVDGESATAIAQMITRAARVLTKEGEKNLKRAVGGKVRAVQPQRTESLTLKDAFEQVIEDAYRHALGTAPRVPARMVAYRVRDLIQKLDGRPDKKLNLQYCTQILIPNYQREHPGALPGVTYEPRGFLLEPHTGVRIPLGTLAVEQYDFPLHRYNKILIIEKKGLVPVLEDARLAELYDMAIVATEGYATTAARLLLQRADKHEQYQIFVVHDADPSGYLICRALREETRRMPGYSVDVIDLGLTYEHAVDDLHLGTEEFERKKALPADLELGPKAREAFEGYWDERKKAWICTRVELNAFTPEGLVQFITNGLHVNGAVGKVAPDDEDVLLDEYAEQLRRAIERRKLAELQKEVEEEFARRWAAEERPDPQEMHVAVAEGLRDDPYSHWRAVLAEMATSQARGEEPER